MPYQNGCVIVVTPSLVPKLGPNPNARGGLSRNIHTAHRSASTRFNLILLKWRTTTGGDRGIGSRMIADGFPGFLLAQEMMVAIGNLAGFAQLGNVAIANPNRALTHCTNR